MSATLAPSARMFTPDDLLRMPGQGIGFELVDGEVKEQNVSFLSSFIAGRIFQQLAMFVEAHRLGWVSPGGTSFRCFPDDPERVRRADTAFHALSRLTVEQALAAGHLTVVPDLVVEVVSPNDTADEVNRKRLEWLVAGARLVWVVHPLQKTIHAYRSDGTVSLFNATDLLTAEPVLSEFGVPVAELFRLPAAGPGQAAVV